MAIINGESENEWRGEMKKCRIENENIIEIMKIMA
jgi:hypothetical protein